MAELIIKNAKIVFADLEDKGFGKNIVIDATGDGDMAARAGCSYTIGREEDSLMQPATLMFKVGGVNMDKALAQEIADAIEEKGEAYKEKVTIQKMALANKAYAHLA